MVNHPVGRTLDAQHIVWAFFMPILHPYNGCHLVNKTALRVSHRSLTNGMCSRFSVSVPGRFSGWLKNDAIMKQLKQLEEQVFSLNNTAENLKEILCVIGALPTMDDNDNNTFPEKLHIMEVISEASLKMKKVAGLIQVVVPEIQDALIALSKTQ